MGRGVSSGGGQSSLGYLFGGGEAPKPAENNAPAEGQVVNNEPPSKKAAAPVDVNKQAPASIHSNKTDGQNTGDFLTTQTKNHSSATDCGGAVGLESAKVEMKINEKKVKEIESGYQSAQDCFICKKGGHQAKDCPEKTTGGFESARFCLKCGVLGHEMFQCNDSYSSEDLQEIQCYVCREFGHLCCIVFNDGLKREVSCYKCGQLGHNGLACTRLRGETTGAATPSSCSKCGEEGYFARECRSCAKAKKHYRLVLKSLKIRRRFHEEKDYIENGSAPPDIGNAPKRKKMLHALAKNLLENQSVGMIG